MADEIQQQTQVKARRGCLFYGCITSVVLLLLILAGALVGLRYFKQMLTKFTDDRPIALPAVNLSPAEITLVRQRADDFRNAVRSAKPTEPLVLKADELNALISDDPTLQALRGRLYVNAIKDDQIQGQISAPMDQLGLPVFRGRYLNASGAFTIELKNGIFRLTAQSLTVKGKPIPERYMEEIRRQNLASGMNDKEGRTSAGLNRLKSIEIKDGKLVITPQSP